MSIQWVDRETLLRTIPNYIRNTESVLDIGCGIDPQQFIKPRFYVCCEPHGEYLEVLKDVLAGTNAVVVQGTAQQTLKWLPDKSMDSVLMIDVIEHVAKSDGIYLISECERIARQQVIIFTPLGFVRQDYQPGEVDLWNLHGTHWQVHRSGWSPDDFDESWHILASKEYHVSDGRGQALTPPQGAFWAIKNLQPSPRAEAIAVSFAAQEEELQPDISRALIQLLSVIDTYIQDMVEPMKIEMALRLLRREAGLGVRETLLDRREARYNSLILVRMMRKMRRVLKNRFGGA